MKTFEFTTVSIERLVITQNYSPTWKSKTGKIINAPVQNENVGPFFKMMKNFRKFVFYVYGCRY